MIPTDTVQRLPEKRRLFGGTRMPHDWKTLSLRLLLMVVVVAGTALVAIGMTWTGDGAAGSTADLEVREPVNAIGYPLGLEGGPSVTTGVVSALGRVLEESTVSPTGVVQTDAAITEGSSGGALLDSAGRLIGMTTAVGVSSVGVEAMGFAIPVETVEGVVGALLGS